MLLEFMWYPCHNNTLLSVVKKNSYMNANELQSPASDIYIQDQYINGLLMSCSVTDIFEMFSYLILTCLFPLPAYAHM